MAENDECFRGSYMDGPDVNIPMWAGLSLSENEEEALWEDVDPVHLLRSIKTGWLDEDAHESGSPGQSDTYYVFRTNDPDACKTELRTAILKTLGKI